MSDWHYDWLDSEHVFTAWFHVPRLHGSQLWTQVATSIKPSRTPPCTKNGTEIKACFSHFQVRPVKFETSKEQSKVKGQLSQNFGDESTVQIQHPHKLTIRKSSHLTTTCGTKKTTQDPEGNHLAILAKAGTRKTTCHLYVSKSTFYSSRDGGANSDPGSPTKNYSAFDAQSHDIWFPSTLCNLG